MKKKPLIAIAIAIAALVITFLILVLYLEYELPFNGNPAKGVVKDPAPAAKCGKSKFVKIKCFKAKHIGRRKHLAYNKNNLYLCQDQRIIIDHDVDTLIDGKHITAIITDIKK